MGQPSYQASNAIIYLTYSAFLCVKSHILPQSRQDLLTVVALETQALRSLRCMVLEESVKITVPCKFVFSQPVVALFKQSPETLSRDSPESLALT